VFTVRYGLIPYIKQIVFSLEKVKETLRGMKTVLVMYKAIKSVYTTLGQTFFLWTNEGCTVYLYVYSLMPTCNFVLLNERSTDSSVGIEIRLRAGKSGARIPGGLRDYLLLYIKTSTEPYPPTNWSVGTRFLTQGQSSQGVKLTMHFHLLPRSRRSGAVPMFPLYTFKAWTRKTILQKYGRKDSKIIKDQGRNGPSYLYERMKSTEK
jgi:hypothetical protein